jgi:hypothetical protein
LTRIGIDPRTILPPDDKKPLIKENVVERLETPAKNIIMPARKATVWREEPDGRVIIIHPWSELELEWLKAYCADNKDVKFLDTIPTDWKWKLKK